MCNEYVELLNAKVSPTESPPFPIPGFQCVCGFIFFPFPQQSGLFLDLCIFTIHSHCVGHYLKRQGPHILWFYDIFWVITSHTGIKSYYMNTLKSVSFSRYLTLILKSYSYIPWFMLYYLQNILRFLYFIEIEKIGNFMCDYYISVFILLLFLPFTFQFFSCLQLPLKFSTMYAYIYMYTYKWYIRTYIFRIAPRLIWLEITTWV